MATNSYRRPASWLIGDDFGLSNILTQIFKTPEGKASDAATSIKEELASSSKLFLLTHDELPLVRLVDTPEWKLTNAATIEQEVRHILRACQTPPTPGKEFHSIWIVTADATSAGQVIAMLDTAFVELPVVVIVRQCGQTALDGLRAKLAAHPKARIKRIVLAPPDSNIKVEADGLWVATLDIINVHSLEMLTQAHKDGIDPDPLDERNKLTAQASAEIAKTVAAIQAPALPSNATIANNQHLATVYVAMLIRLAGIFGITLSQDDAEEIWKLAYARMMTENILAIQPKQAVVKGTIGGPVWQNRADGITHPFNAAHHPANVQDIGDTYAWLFRFLKELDEQTPVLVEKEWLQSAFPIGLIARKLS